MRNNISKVIVLLFLNIVFLQISQAGGYQFKDIVRTFSPIDIYQLNNTANALRLNDVNLDVNQLVPIAVGVYRVSTQHYEINILLKNIGEETVYLSYRPSEYIFELTDDQGTVHNIALQNINTECSSGILAGEECMVTILAAVEINRDTKYVSYTISVPYQLSNNGGFKESTVVDVMSEIKISNPLHKSARNPEKYKLTIEAIAETIPDIVDIYLDKSLDEYIEPFNISFTEDMECYRRFCKISFKLKDNPPEKSAKGYMFIVYEVVGEEQLKILLIPIEITCWLNVWYWSLGAVPIVGSTVFILQKFLVKLQDFVPCFSSHHGQDIQAIGYPNHPYGHQCRNCIVRRNHWIAEHPDVLYHSNQGLPLNIYSNPSQELFVIMPDMQRILDIADYPTDLTLSGKNCSVVNQEMPTEDFFHRLFLYNSTVLVQ